MLDEVSLWVVYGRIVRASKGKRELIWKDQATRPCWASKSANTAKGKKRGTYRSWIHSIRRSPVNNYLFCKTRLSVMLIRMQGGWAVQIGRSKFYNQAVVNIVGFRHLLRSSCGCLWVNLAVYSLRHGRVCWCKGWFGQLWRIMMVERKALKLKMSRRLRLSPRTRTCEFLDTITHITGMDQVCILDSRK